MGAVGTPLFPCIGRLGNRTGRNHVQQVLPLTLHSRAGLVGREAGVDVRHGHPCGETGTLGQSSHVELNASRFSGNKRSPVQTAPVDLPVLLPLCFLQVATLPWPPTFEPCCRERAAACLPGPPPRAAAVMALCS